MAGKAVSKGEAKSDSTCGEKMEKTNEREKRRKRKEEGSVDDQRR